MQWTTDDPWKIGFAHAEEYFRTHQELLSAGQYVCNDGYRLGSWIANQRTKYDKGFLTAEQIHRLENIGMVWDVLEMRWNSAYQLAKEYYEKYGNLNVPIAYNNEIDFDLYDWLKQQRENYRNGKISEQRKQLLDEMHFDWLTLKERQWEDYFACAEKYYRKNGNLKVPVTYRDGFWLDRWISTQRKNKGKLTDPQIQRLNDIGMEW